jgi:hypothetical protein
VLGWGFWALEISGKVLLEDELVVGIASLRHGADGLELHQPEWYSVVVVLLLAAAG